MTRTAHSALAEHLAALPVVSTHEHHREDAFHADLDLDKLFANSYVGWINPLPGPIRDRARFLDAVGHSAYFRWLERGLRHIYGVGPITPETWDAVSEAIRQAHVSSPTWHVALMRRFGHYRRAIQDSYWAPGSAAGHPDFFAPTFRINCYVLCHHPLMTDHNGNSPWQRHDLAGLDFDAYLLLLDQVVAEQKQAGAVALKSALAYDRDLAFTSGDRETAARVFGAHPNAVSDADRRAYQDFLLHHLCELAARHDLPFQHHTGLAKLSGSRPLNLEPTIARHPQTRFVLFHGGFPWVHEIGGLLHHYRNVYPDLTWLPLIAPTAAIRAVREWLELGNGAANLCWGGDAWTGEESVGAALALKHVLSVALGQLVEEGSLGLEDARRIAGQVCHENAARIYGLG